MKRLILLLLFIPLFGCAQIDCSTLPRNFSSYPQAIYAITHAKYVIKESKNTSRSSFVTSAAFYSCDGKTGYLIIGLNGKEYIHEQMPVSIWKGFKQANSLGQYYNSSIKGRYTLVLRH